MSFTRTASEVWRKFNTDGVQSSGRHEPDVDHIKLWGTEVEGSVQGAPAYREVIAAGTVTVGPTDYIVGINKTVGAATAVTVPLAANRSGVPVVIKDIKGDAATNPITPAFTGGEMCDGQPGSSFVISTNFGFVKFYPRTGGYYQA